MTAKATDPGSVVGEQPARPTLARSPRALPGYVKGATDLKPDVRALAFDRSGVVVAIHTGYRAADATAVTRQPPAAVCVLARSPLCGQLGCCCRVVTNRTPWISVRLGVAVSHADTGRLRGEAR
jgi:hypothetical protein